MYLAQIRFMLLQNRQGKTRLSKWYVPYEDAEKQAIQVPGLCLSAACPTPARLPSAPRQRALMSSGPRPRWAGGLPQGGDSARGQVHKFRRMAHPQACVQVRLALWSSPAPRSPPRWGAWRLCRCTRTRFSGPVSARRWPELRTKTDAVTEDRRWRAAGRRYAGLFFTPCVDVNDNELGCLEAIHLFVEVLDQYFGNVCELDLVFNFHKVGAARTRLEHMRPDSRVRMNSPPSCPPLPPPDLVVTTAAM